VLEEGYVEIDHRHVDSSSARELELRNMPPLLREIEDAAYGAIITAEDEWSYMQRNIMGQKDTVFEFDDFMPIPSAVEIYGREASLDLGAGNRFAKIALTNESNGLRWSVHIARTDDRVAFVLPEPPIDQDDPIEGSLSMSVDVWELKTANPDDFTWDTLPLPDISGTAGTYVEHLVVQ
jgi:hypothetical protein